MKKPNRRWAFLSLLIAACLLPAKPVLGKDGPQRPSDVFRTTNLWTVHFKFTPEQWKALEPEDHGGSGPFGPPGNSPGPRRFGPAMFLAPVFMKEGDQNQDGQLSKTEFRSLAQTWFAEWDKEKIGKLDANQLRAGLNAKLATPPPGPPQSELKDPQSKVQPRERPPGMNLQGLEGKRNGLASAMGVEFKFVHADLDFDGQLLRDVAVRYKGNGTFMESRGSLKRSFKVDLNKNVKGQKWAGLSKLNFHNNVTDPSWMNEVLAHQLYRDAGVPAPRTAYARVFVSVPGLFQQEYFGLYSMVEDIDKNFAEETFATKKGALFKPVTPALFSDLGDHWKDYHQTYDPKTRLTPEQEQRVIDFCKLTASAPDAAFAAKLGDYIELDEFARFMAVMVFLSDLDGILGPGQNFYLYLSPETGRFQFISWDQDHSFGQFGMRGTQEERENLSIQKPWQGENRFLERVFKVEAFQRLYLAKIDQFSRSLFKPERFEREVNDLAAVLRPAVLAESKDKLASFESAVAGAASEPRGPGGPGGFGQPLKPIKPFVKVRAQSVRDQIAGKSTGQTVSEFRFGGRGGRGGPGGPGGFGPGDFLARQFAKALDANHDGEISRDEFIQGFAKWFATWNTDQSGLLTDRQLGAGIDQDLSPVGGEPPDSPHQER